MREAHKLPHWPVQNKVDNRVRIQTTNHGQIPEEAPDKEFVTDNMDDEEEDDEFGLNPEDYDNLDFDENWN